MKALGPVIMMASLLLLSGCTTPTQPAAGDPDGSGTGADGTVDAPEWDIGRYWSYDTLFGPFTMVVSGESGGDWIVDTTVEEMAYFHALDAISYLGEVRKSDLAGSQGGDRVKFFDFPLEDGKSWTTPWDGVRLEITATRSDDNEFHMVGMDGSRTHVEYIYDIDKEFFKEVTWYAEDSDEEWGMSLTGTGQGYTGTLHRFEIGTTHSIVHGPEGSQVHELEIQEKWNQIGLHGMLFCNDDPVGQILLGVNSPREEDDLPLPMVPTVNDPETGYILDCTQEPEWMDSWVMANPGGTWEIGILVAAPNGLAHLFLEERAHHEIAFP